jgi:hypothetical protein
MARYVNTKETAVLLRQALKAAFPATKFGVRKGTGTASTWIDVSWTDGPTEKAVDAIADTYQGSKFNGMTDNYDQMPDQLVSFSAEELPEEVRFGVSGILTHRTMSEEGKRAALNVLIENNRTVAIVDANGDYNEKLNRDFVHMLYAPGYNISNSYDLPNATWRIFAQMDLSKVAVTK